jgi:hypothetical protein
MTEPDYIPTKRERELKARVAELEAALRDLLRSCGGSHAEDCNAYGAMDDEASTDPSTGADPFCGCGALIVRERAQTALKSASPSVSEEDDIEPQAGGPGLTLEEAIKLYGDRTSEAPPIGPLAVACPACCRMAGQECWLEATIARGESHDGIHHARRKLRARAEQRANEASLSYESDRADEILRQSPRGIRGELLRLLVIQRAYHGLVSIRSEQHKETARSSATGSNAPPEEHEKKWCCRSCGTLILGQWAGNEDGKVCPDCRPKITT